MASLRKPKKPRPPYRILVTGDRHWKDYQFILNTLVEYMDDTEVIIQGEARGADECALKAAKCLGIKHLDYPADWEKNGRAAGPIRNRQMLKEGKPNLVLAFHDNIKESAGTADMIKAARKAGIFTILHSHDEDKDDDNGES